MTITHAPESPGKVAILSHVLPPSSSGQAVVLYRLLRDWDPRCYCLISTRDYSADKVQHEQDTVTRHLPADYHCLPAETNFRVMDSRPYQIMRTLFKGMKNVCRHFTIKHEKSNAKVVVSESPSVSARSGQSHRSSFSKIKDSCHSMIQGWDDWVNLRGQVKQRAATIRAILRKEYCTALVACSGDLIDLPAAFLAAQQEGIPCYAYMLDDYPHQWVVSSQRKFAQSIGREVITQAAGVIVPNEFLANAYRETYGIESIIVRNPVEDLPAPPSALLARSSSQPFRIVYTGMIYQAHFDSFIRLAQALARIPVGQVELHLYTKSDAAFLAENGIGYPAFIHASVSNAEALKLQRTADLLFLPLAFCSSIPEIIRTSAPGKMGEYLASGCPVLAHGPSDSFLSSYCRTHECAAVVDIPDVDLLYRAIVDLMRNPDWGNRLVQNAWKCARDEFHLPRVQRCFNAVFARRAA